MAEQLVCQNCNKSYYTTESTTPHPCPHCGFIFNSKRAEERFHWSAYCHIFDEKIYNPMHAPLVAKTQDISQHGVKIRYVGEPLTPGDTVDIQIVMFNLIKTAHVMWSKSINKTDSLVGLKLIEPISTEVLYQKELT